MTKILTEQMLAEFTKGTVMIDVYAPWCGPCQNMMPIVDTLADEYNDRIQIGKINMDDYTEYLQENFQIEAIPTFIFFKDGIEVHRYTGALPEDSLRMKLEGIID